MTPPGQSNDDSLTVYQTGLVPDENGFVQFHSGLGSNTLLVLTGSVRIDATVDPAAELTTTVTDRGQLTSHRFRQSWLRLGSGSRATVLPDGTDAATSVLGRLQINAGATVDLNDNALILDYTDESPVDAIRAKIIEGRGGSGFGQKWNGTGITSSAAAQAVAISTDSRSLGYAENARLPLGRYTSFRGQPVDDTAVLIAYTRTGDANLDGTVDNDDVAVVGASFAPDFARPAWALGDFEYNGFVDNDDLTLLGSFYNPARTEVPPPQDGDSHGTAPATASAEGNDARHALQTRQINVPRIPLRAAGNDLARNGDVSAAFVSYFESLSQSDALLGSIRRKRVAKWTASFG